VIVERVFVGRGMDASLFFACGGTLMAVSGDTVLPLVFPCSGCFRPTSVVDTEEPGDRVIVVSISVVGEAFGWLRTVLLKWDAIEEDVWPLNK
jgi:fumarate reductase subunit D